jgi:hypothetical protein
MRTWNLKVSPPLMFSLAADARLGATSYTNDHIWELNLGGGDPPALSLQTTFGLRARSFRIFPRFTEETTTVSNPADFASPLILQAMAPNYLRLAFSPLPELLVTVEYWAATSQAVAGRFTLENRAAVARTIRFDLAANLSPAVDGQRMMPLEMNAVSVLTGISDGLQPVLFLGGGPRPETGVYPALMVERTLSSRERHSLIWAQVALATAEESFEFARQLTARNWESELARIELVNGGAVEIYTGDPQWDFALALSQKIAFGLLLNPAEPAAPPSFVLTRSPDQGYSPRGDGSDYPPLWSGQTPLDTYQLLDQILPSSPQMAAGLLRNFLATTGEDGFMDWKPGLAGQRSQIWATPLLATLAERVYQATQDRALLEESFPLLLAFLHGWMSQHDRDADGIPEWDHPTQTGFEEHPLFSRWQDGSQNIEITTTEGPDLCAFIYRECQALKRLATALERPEASTALQGFSDNLRAAAEAAWDVSSSNYHYWDRDSHRRTRAEFLGELIGPGEMLLERRFDPPARLQLRLQISGEQGRQVTIFVDGEGAAGQNRVERISGEQFRWRQTLGRLTGERVYTAIHRITVQGLAEEDRFSVHTVGLDAVDQTLLLPLWAGMASPEHAQQLVANTITNPERFWRPFGLRACIPHTLPHDAAGAFLTAVHVPWNTLIGEGLLAYGYRDEAALLVGRLMRSALACLRRDGAFRRFYDADTGAGSGERNALPGLPPVGLFLSVLGVSVRSSWEVALDGSNPFPWPVTVKYRGLTVLRRADKTTVVFPDGQMVEVTDPAACVVANV